jgi:hypothetical protein
MMCEYLLNLKRHGENLPCGTSCAILQGTGQNGDRSIVRAIRRSPCKRHAVIKSLARDTVRTPDFKSRVVQQETRV